MDGRLPPEVSKLTKLTTLNVDDNPLDLEALPIDLAQLCAESNRRGKRYSFVGRPDDKHTSAMANAIAVDHHNAGHDALANASDHLALGSSGDQLGHAHDHLANLRAADALSHKAAALSAGTVRRRSVDLSASDEAGGPPTPDATHTAEPTHAPEHEPASEQADEGAEEQQRRGASEEEEVEAKVEAVPRLTVVASAPIEEDMRSARKVRVASCSTLSVTSTASGGDSVAAGEAEGS